MDEVLPEGDDRSVRNGHWHPAHHANVPSPIVTELSFADSEPSSPVLSRSTLRSSLLLPHQDRSLSGISIRSFLLGLVLAFSICACLTLAYHEQRVWRAPFFLAALSLFHWLEFYITARYNTQFADISAFLLSRNGRAYNIAHTAAMAECIVTSLFFPGWQARFSARSMLLLGLSSILIGQAARTLAMVQAGTNFNHTVQTRKADGHQLVTTGIYSWLRHPSYFGFFWWGLGTQIVCGNIICLLGYTLVLWNFFKMRIGKEEEYLVEFFGSEYADYKKRTTVGIPGIP